MTGFNVHDAPVHFDVIRPGKPVELMINRFGNHPDEDVHISWRSQEDLDDELATTTEPIPPRN